MSKISKENQHISVDADYVLDFLKDNSNRSRHEAYELLKRLAADYDQDYAMILADDVPDYFKDEAKLIFDNHPEFKGILVVTFNI